MTFPLVDSDVLIDVLRKDALAERVFYALLNQGPVTVSVVSRMETIQGCLNREAQQQTERLLKRVEVLGLDLKISACADQLVTQYYLSNHLVVSDALIAATALVYDLPLLSKNQRDFRFISELTLLPYPSA